MKYRYLIYILSLAILTACEPKIDEFSPSKGSADFTTYLAFGNSLTAGYADNALYSGGQENSYPNILATQFKTVGMQGDFKQPLMPTNNGVGVELISTGLFFHTKYILGYATDCLGQQSLAPVFADPDASQTDLMNQLIAPVVNQGPFNNIGVPGLKSYEALSAICQFNPYYARFKSPDANFVLEEIPKINPTFFTLWLGANDVLRYASAGGASDSITSMPLFSSSMDAIITSLTQYGTKGAIATIPHITSFPFFNTVPYNAIVLTDQSLVDALNLGYAPYNTIMEAMGLEYRINFQLGANPMVIADPTIPLPDSLAMLKMRQIQNTELVLLSIPHDSLKCAYWGSQIPVPDQYILSESEIAAVSDAINNYNIKIKDLAKLHPVALVDMNTYLNEFESGMVFDGINFNVKFIEGGLFSLDGVHLNNRGYALVANYFIKDINRTFNANIPQVNITDYPGTQFP